MALKYNVFTGQFDIDNTFSGTANGDVVGPASSTDNAVSRFNGTAGKTIQNSGVIIDDSNNITGAGSVTSGPHIISNAGTSRSIDLTSSAAHGSAVMFLNQTHADHTGSMIKVANAGDGFGLDIKNSDGANNNYINLEWAGTTQYAMIKWRDTGGTIPVILTAHDQHATLGDHRHFTIYTTDNGGTNQGRFYVEYGRQDPLITAQKIHSFQIFNTPLDDTANRKNRNYLGTALDVRLSNEVTDGGTYTLGGHAARFSVANVDTSGAITNSANSLYLENLGDTGTALYIDQQASGPGISLVNAGVGNGITVDQNADTGSTSSTDGAIHIENTGNPGIGLGVYSNMGASANGPLVSLHADNAAFDQTTLYVNSDQTGAMNTVLLEGDSTTTGATLRVLNTSTGYGMYLDHNGAGTGIIVDHDDTGTAASVNIDRDGNNASAITGLTIDVANAGAGGATAVNVTAGSAVFQAINATTGVFSGDVTVPDEVYGAGWNGSLEVPTKNALYDKIETISAGSGVSEALALAYAAAL